MPQRGHGLLFALAMWPGLWSASGCAVLSTQILIPWPEHIVWSTAPTAESASSTAPGIPDWEALFATGSFRQQRDWSPLAISEQAQRSGLRWSRHRWEWEIAAAEQPALVDARHWLATNRSPDHVAEFVKSTRSLPEPVRRNLAIWVAVDSPELSVRLAALDQVVAPHGSPLEKMIRALPLKSAAEVGEISLDCRHAAAIAWCHQLRHRKRPTQSDESQAGQKEIETALAPAGLALTEDRIPLEVREELMVALARDIPLTRLPQWREWVAVSGSPQSSPDDQSKLRAACEAALVYLVSHRSAASPVTREHGSDNAEVITLLQQADAPTGSRAWQCRVGSLALAGDQEVIGELSGGLRAREWGVRLHAAICLGLHPDPAAEEELRKARQAADDSLSELALRGLACRDGFDAADWVKSAPRVREALAEVLCKFPGENSASVLADLVSDTRPSLQEKAVRTIVAWPDEYALAPLLEGLGAGSYATRLKLHHDLERRLGRPVPFPLGGDPRARGERVEVLTHELGADLPRLANSPNRSATPRGDDLRRRELQLMLARVVQPPTSDPEIVQDTAPIDARDLPLLEQMLAEAASDQERELLLSNWLPLAHPAYEALRDLQSTDVVVRRRGADRLRQQGASQTLPREVLRRMSTRLATEQDPLVFRSALRAVADDSTDDALAVVKTAIHSPWDDIRAGGVEYLGNHRVASAAPWLLPLIDSGNPTLQRLAVRSAGLCGNPITLDGTRNPQGDVVYRGLRPLLTSGSLELRRETVLAMARLGDADGLNELARSLSDADPAARAWGLRAMREAGNPRFVSLIARMLWVERDTRVRQEGLEALATLVPGDQQPRIPPTANQDERIAIWVMWNQEQSNGATVSNGQ